VKVLLVKTSSMGDVIHALPAVTDAFAAVPGLELDWCVEEAFADIPRFHPRVGTVHRVALRRWRHQLTSAAAWSEFLAVRRQLRHGGYDRVVDLQGLLKSLLFARMPGAPITGYVREAAAGLGYHHRPQVPPDVHLFERNRRIMAAALGYQPDLSRLDYGITPPPAPALVAGRDRLALLLHGTTWASKRWPTPFWVELAERLAARGLVPAVPFGDAAEQAVANAIAGRVGDTLVIPKSSLRDVAGIIGAAAVVIGTESGLMHLAAVFGRPTLALFAGSSPGNASPQGPRAGWIGATTACAPCGKRSCPLYPRRADLPCHATVTPELVLDALDRLTYR
jgi:heptosyltransferase-1